MSTFKHYLVPDAPSMASIKQALSDRNTPRKRKITLNKWIADNEYIIDYIAPKINANGVCYYHGEIMLRRDLKAYEVETAFLKENFNQLINN